MPDDGTHDPRHAAKPEPTHRLQLRVAFPQADRTTDQDPQLLLRWLAEDPDLHQGPRPDQEPGTGPLIQAEPRKAPSRRDQMGLLDDIVVSLVTTAVELAVFQLVRSIYSHLRNRRGTPLEVTVTVPGTVPELTLTLATEGEHTKEQLDSWASAAARAVADRRAE